MQILSATDAISPALARTKLILYSPFRKGRPWKLAVTGYISLCSALFLPLPLIYLCFFPMIRSAVGDRVAWLVVAGILVTTAVFLVVFYLASRLQFSFFDIVLNRGEDTVRGHGGGRG